MSSRRPCPPAPGPLEDYAQRFDVLFSSLAQRRGLRDYLQGLLLPRDRNKTLTGLAGAEPISGAQHREVQRLQWFLSESAWDHEQVNDQRVRLLCEDPATAPHGQGALVIDDTGDRRPRGCPQVRGILGSGPSRSWRSSLSRPPVRPASGSGRW
jgi:SRSO17 transposase